jgi:Carboxypeptidase regulatory-like domain/TonB-dependent Receptor Plug Domain/TonB dependent receptor
MTFRMNLSRILKLILCAVVVLSACGALRLHAQAVGATLSGTVTDPSGGVIPKAEVVILNAATGETHNVSSNAEGIYSAPNVPPGNYTVTVTAAGFSKAVQNGITLTVGGTQVLNVAMQVGQASQTVEVTTEAPTVNLTNAEIGALTTEAAIKELPLNGRSWSDLANLTTGVYQLHTQPNLESRDRFTRGYGIQLSISGSRPQQNNYRVDGVSINDPGNGGPGSVLGANSGVDAIAEFSVLTTGYSTEYGRASGGIINATTKSGSNQFHGSGYEFLRNSWLDAPNFFDPNGITPPFRRNQFGASAGGPIIKNKTFVFGDYEGLRQSLGISKVSQVPSVAGAASADPAITPYLTALFPVGGTLNGKQLCVITPTSDPFHDNCSFGANQVSSENYYIIRADHTISDKDHLSGTFFRDKASTGTPDNYSNQVVNTATSETFATIAETHTFGTNFVNSARFGFNRVTQGGPAGATPNNPAAADAAFGIFAGLDAPQVAIGGANAIKFSGGITSNSPQKNNWNSYQFYDDAFWTKGKHSLKFGANVERIQLNVFRSARPGGIFAYSSWAAFLNNCGAQKVGACAALGGTGTASITTDIPGTLAPEEERQSVFGVYIQDDYHVRQNLTINLGLRYEPTTVPFDPKGRNATLDSIYDTTKTQLPLCGTLFTDANGNPTCNSRNGPLFKNNTLHDFDPRVGFAWDPKGNGKMSIRGGAGLYDQLPLPAFMGSTSNGNTAPFLVSGSSSNLAQGSFGQFSSFGPCPAPPVNPGDPWPVGTSTACQVSAAGQSRVAFIDRTPKRAYVIQYNLSVQREIAPNTTVLVGYVGSHGVHGTTQVDDVNQVLPKFIGGSYFWPCDKTIHPPFATFTGGNTNDCPGRGDGNVLNQSWGRLPATFFRNSSLYNGLQVQLNKQMSHGFQVSAGFTWQKSIDTASGAVISDSVITAISTQQWIDPKLTRAVSDFNDAKVFTLNYLWDVPTPKSWSGFTRSAAGGWELGGIFSASSGEPFTPLLSEGDVLGQNNSDPFAYPNRLPSCGNSLTNPGNIANYIKLQCFVIPPVTTINGVNYIPLGNAGRNILTGPGLVDFDFSVVKNTKITRISESFNVQLRLDVFNLFNRANFNPPVTNMFIMDPTTVGKGIVANPGPAGPCTGNDNNSGCNPNAGALDGGDGTATTSRQMQVSLKIIW